MSSLKTSIILVWPGTNAAIPEGWERETDLDGKYPKGTARCAIWVKLGLMTYYHATETKEEIQRRIENEEF